MEKNIKVEPINLTLKNEIMFCCNELPFGILPPNSYLNIETMNIISSYDGEYYYASYCDNIDDGDYVNYYDSVDSYYVNCYGCVDDD